MMIVSIVVTILVYHEKAEIEKNLENGAK